MSPLRSLGNTLSAFKDFYSRTGTDASKPPSSLIEGFDIMLVAGGGSGGGSVGGGGGAGGIIYAASVSLASGAYVMNVGAGANQTPQGSNAGTNGADTTFGISGTAYLTALGGGGGASGTPGGSAEHILPQTVVLVVVDHITVKVVIMELLVLVLNQTLGLVHLEVLQVPLLLDTEILADQFLLLVIWVVVEVPEVLVVFLPTQIMPHPQHLHRVLGNHFQLFQVQIFHQLLAFMV